MKTMEPPRTEYLGGSEIASALGLGTYDDPQTIWARKTGRKKEKEPTLDMIRGTLLEPIVRQHCVAEDARVVQVMDPDFFVDPDFPHLGSHDDGALLGFGHDHPGVLEVKCPSRFAFDTIREQGLPNENVIQLTFGMGVSGRSWGVFAVHCADSWETLLFPLEFDAELYGWLRRQGEVWWRKFVQGDTPPPNLVDESPPPIPKVSGEAVYREDQEWLELVDEAAVAYETKSEIEKILDGTKEETGLKERILDLMGDAKTIIGGGYRVHQIITKGRTIFDPKLLEEVGPFDPEITERTLRDAINLPGVADLIMIGLKKEARIDVEDDRFYKTTAPARFPRVYRSTRDE